MDTIFQLSRLYIKKKIKVLTPDEELQLVELKKVYPFIGKPNFKNISENLSVYEIIDKEKAWENIERKKEHSKPIPISQNDYSSWLKYAAVVLVFLGLGFLYQQGHFGTNTTLDIPNEFITLELENGNTKIINEDGTFEVMDKQGKIIGNKKGKTLVYGTNESNYALVYNTLTVPYGKRFDVQLSDGTKVYLNAGTSLKYPVSFIEGQDRKVFLNGEAFFKVSKDDKHPFVVNAEEINVRVLGTHFNVSSYPEDEQTTTVLIEGSVGVYKSEDSYSLDTSTLLRPGFKAEWNPNSKKFQVDTADTEIHTAWMEGKLILNGVLFSDILKKLERQYNVVFINNNKALENRRFTARFDEENIHQVLKSFSYSASFTYTFKNNMIIINP